MNPTGTGLPPSPARWMRLLNILHESCMRTCQIRGVHILLLSPSKSFHSYCIVHYTYIRTNMAIQNPCHARTIQYHLTIREFFCQEHKSSLSRIKYYEHDLSHYSSLWDEAFVLFSRSFLLDTIITTAMIPPIINNSKNTTINIIPIITIDIPVIPPISLISFLVQCL